MNDVNASKRKSVALEDRFEGLVASVHGRRELVPVRHRVELAEELHVSAVQMGVQAGLVLRPVRAQGTVELGLHAALVLQMPRQARVVIVDLAAVLAGIGDPSTVEEPHRPRLWKTRKAEEVDIRDDQWTSGTLSRRTRFVGIEDSRRYEANRRPASFFSLANGVTIALRGTAITWINEYLDYPGITAHGAKRHRLYFQLPTFSSIL